MATCKDCLHVEVCKDYAINYLKGTPIEALEKEVGDYPCCHFQDRSLFVELPDYKYSAEERFQGAVQELIDIAKASETPSKILQATSESLAHFAYELSKLEETKQTLKERES